MVKGRREEKKTLQYSTLLNNSLQNLSIIIFQDLIYYLALCSSIEEGWAIKLILVGNHEIYFLFEPIFVSNIMVALKKKAMLGNSDVSFLPLLPL